MEDLKEKLRETAPAALGYASEVVRALGFGGSACLCWTVIVCFVIAKTSDCTFLKLWPTLYGTWLVLAAIWFVLPAIFAAFKSRASGAAVPHVAASQPPPPDPKTPPPGGNA